MIQNFCVLLLRHANPTLKTRLHTSSYLRNFYDTLKLKSNATSKEIREAFLKLSKENHPDINKNPNAHKEFLKIQEAYSVLSKPSSRATYDVGISNPSPNRSYGPSYGPHTAPNQGYSRPRYGGPFRTTYGQYGRNPWDDPSFYRNRNKSEFNYEGPYYGVKGIKRQSNGRVALFIGLFTIMMFVLQMLAIRYTVSKQQAYMNARSAETQRLLDETRERAERNGNAKQLEIFKEQWEENERLRQERSSTASR